MRPFVEFELTLEIKERKHTIMFSTRGGREDFIESVQAAGVKLFSVTTPDGERITLHYLPSAITSYTTVEIYHDGRGGAPKRLNVATTIMVA